MFHADGFKGLLIFLIAAGIIVPLLHRLRVGTVLGFLLVGMALGPHGLGQLADEHPWVRYVTLDDPRRAEPLAELGIVFLLFLLGMELSLQRLWQLRRYVLGVGLVQVVVTVLAIGATVRLAGIRPPAGVILGMCLALSSTAMVMQIMVAQRRAATPVGRISLSVLLFQDLMVVPILFVVGILEARHAGNRDVLELLLPFGQAFAAVILIMVVGKYLVSPLMRSAARTGSRELIMAITLVIVFSITGAMGEAGLSVALGAFLAGLLLGESEYRHQIEVDLDPFKGLLLGLFFVTVGMSVDLAEVARHAGWIFLSLFGLVAAKALILYGAARLFRVARPVAAEIALLLAQAGEFAFVVIGLARGKELLEPHVATAAVAVAGLSMIVTPVLAALARRLAERLEPLDHSSDRPDDDVSRMRDHVIIGGFGRVGQAVARVLDNEKVPWVAFDTNGALVAEQRAADRAVYFGDASHREILQHAGVANARAIVITLDGAAAAERAVDQVLTLRPNAQVFARAKDPEHALRLSARGAVSAIPETVEASLQLVGRLLEALDFPPDAANARVAQERAYEMALLKKIQVGQH
ncbi:MAG: potassium transporter TrkA [Alphaproteobacteria bacterium]|nr:MAG: potassium transporter TrkA [Alphaproteobacteria bacterium]